MVLALSDLVEQPQQYLSGKSDVPSIITDFVSDQTAKLLEKKGSVEKLNNQEITILDVGQIEFHSDDELVSFFLKHFNLDIIENPELVGEIFNSAISLYESRYLRHVPPRLKKVDLSKVCFIRTFLNDNRNDGIVCDILKQFYSLAGLSTIEQVKYLDQIHNELISRTLRIASVNQNYAGRWVGAFRKPEEISLDNADFTEVDVFGRQKSLASLVGKEISSSEYSLIDHIYDLNAVTIEVDGTSDEIINIMQQYYHGLYERVDDIDNKGTILLTDITESKVVIDDDFRKALISNCKDQDDLEGKGTAKEYSDIKFKGVVRVTIKDEKGKPKVILANLELKFVKKGVGNEKGIRFQPIYDYIKRFRELTRMGSLIRMQDVVNYVNDFFANLDGNLTYKGKDKATYYKELFDDLVSEGCIDRSVAFDLLDYDLEHKLEVGLANYFLKRLKKVRHRKNGSWYYVYNFDYEKKKNAGLYKELLT